MRFSLLNAQNAGTPTLRVLETRAGYGSPLQPMSAIEQNNRGYVARQGTNPKALITDPTIARLIQVGSCKENGSATRFEPRHS
jgi:hypothetical protein